MGSRVLQRLAHGARRASVECCLLALLGLAPTERAAAADSAAVVPAVMVAKEQAPPVDVMRTRFIIGLEQQVAFHTFALANPYRLVVDLPDTKFQLPDARPGHATGLVKSFVGGLVAPGKVRIVIELSGPVLIETAAIETLKDGKQPRLVIEMLPTDERTFDVGQTRRPLFAEAASMLGGLFGGDAAIKDSKVKSKPSGKPVIVLDPGHGGHDSGASRNGAVEKNIVLAFGLMLREKLKATGKYEIRMTREDDTFVELDERRDFAQRHQASLFMAIHADSAHGGARGATIYSLREGVANTLSRALKRNASEVELDKYVVEAAQQSKSSLDAIKSILGDLKQRDLEATKSRTEVFSKTVAETMSEATTLKPDPIREAAFRVLKTAQVPSVLIELGYVTNREDAQLLQSQEWQDKVSDSILAAVDSYFSNPDVRFPH